MDHARAEQLGAADRYLMDEFSDQDRLEFEEHFFDCPVCCDKVRKGAIFIENAREVLRRELPEASSKSRDTAPWWKTWIMNPRLSVPSFAAVALAALLGFNNLVPAPASFQAAATIVIQPATRGKATVIPVNRRQPSFILNFRTDSLSESASYTGAFTDDNGATITTKEANSRDPSASKLSFMLPTAKFPDGTYEMKLTSRSEPEHTINEYAFRISTGDSK